MMQAPSYQRAETPLSPASLRMDTSLRNELTESALDVLVVGAGITGACIAREAAACGLSVGLIDRADFAAGASANCLKIVHGGLRYLQHLDLRRMRESINERSIWLRSAPHLVEPLPVLLPTYRDHFPSRVPLAIAAAFNEAISADRNRGLLPDRMIPRARMLSRRETIETLPELDTPKLSGGILFHDGIMYSAERLTLEVVAAACSAGAKVASYTAFEAPIVERNRVSGARLINSLTGDALEVRTRWIVNATGSDVTGVAQRLTGRRLQPPQQYSVALNLVTYQPARSAAFSVSCPVPRHGRMVRRQRRRLFVVPWRGQTLIGTAHVPFTGDPAAFELRDEYVETFVREVAAASPSLAVSPDQIAIVHRGLLPVATGAATPEVRLLRRQRVLDHSQTGVRGALSVVSVKFTTAPALARQVVGAILPSTRWRSVSTRPRRLPLAGGMIETAESFGALCSDAQSRWGTMLPPDTIEHLVRTYGVRYEAVLACRHQHDRWNERVAENAPVVYAQLLHGAASEHARTVDDLLWRRTELGPRGLITERARQLAAEALGMVADS